jgi:hypothetical protein
LIGTAAETLLHTCTEYLICMYSTLSFRLLTALVMGMIIGIHSLLRMLTILSLYITTLFCLCSSYSHPLCYRTTQALRLSIIKELATGILMHVIDGRTLPAGLEVDTKYMPVSAR